MSTKIVKFPLDKETGYPGLNPMEWLGDPRKLYAAARWLKKLLDSGSYIPALEYNDDEIFVISEDDNGFEMSVPNTVTDEALHVLADMLWGMGDYLWKTRFKMVVIGKPTVIIPGGMGDYLWKTRFKMVVIGKPTVIIPGNLGIAG